MKRPVIISIAISLVLISCVLLFVFVNKCEHEFTSQITQEATCATEGILTNTCALCGEVTTEPIATVPHTFGEETATRNSTCKDEGAIYTQCINCKAENIVETIAKTNDHTFVNEVLRSPTCSDPGEGKDVCSLCGHTQTCTYELLPHHYGSGTVTSAPSCSAAGICQYTCADCGYVKNEELSPLSHKWREVYCSSPVTCAVCGHVNPDGLGHNYELVHERTASENFLGERHYQCTNCSDRWMEYDGYDLEEIRQTANAYAASLGLNPIISDQMQNSNKKSFKETVFMTERKGGQTYLIREAKKLVDLQYEYTCRSAAGPSAYDFWIIVGYSESGALGTGGFYMYAFVG